jgi:membrane-bound serine protease (ClpP class)
MNVFNQMWFQPIYYLLPFIFVLILGAALTVAALSRHKKGATHQLNLLGATAIVETTLKPEGSVLVRGELWRATSRMSGTIERGQSVRVLSASGHLLEVEPRDIALP